MSDTHSTPATRSAKPNKPNKPYPEFPLYAHAAGVWAKKIRGKVHYFGPWNDPDGALKNYLAQKEDLHAGKKPREDTEGLTVKGLANHFLNHKKALLDARELSQRTWDDYKMIKRSEFANCRGVTPKTIGRMVNRGDVPAPIKVGGVYRWPADVVAKFLREKGAAHT
jgi:hypothetical protein